MTNYERKRVLEVSLKNQKSALKYVRMGAFCWEPTVWDYVNTINRQNEKKIVNFVDSHSLKVY